MSSFADFETAVETLLAGTPEQQRDYLRDRYTAGAAANRHQLSLSWSLPRHESPRGAQGADSPDAGWPVDRMPAG
jgi:hypothetical protein